MSERSRKARMRASPARAGRTVPEVHDAEVDHGRRHNDPATQVGVRNRITIPDAAGKALTGIRRAIFGRNGSTDTRTLP